MKIVAEARLVSAPELQKARVVGRAAHALTDNNLTTHHVQVRGSARRGTQVEKSQFPARLMASQAWAPKMTRRGDLGAKATTVVARTSAKGNSVSALGGRKYFLGDETVVS